MIIRTYRCEACREVFEVTVDDASAADPDCPYCAKELKWQPGMFQIKTSKSRAVDLTQQIIEQDYGMTNMKDGLREGDVAAITPVQSTEQRELTEKLEKDARELYAQASGPMSPQAQQFFSGTGGPMQTNIAQAALADAKQSKGSYPNPMDMLAEAGRKGQLPVGFRVIAKG